MKKILVTGATGFIGNYVVNELLRRECRVIATSLHAAKAEKESWFSRVKYIPFDLNEAPKDLNYFDFFEEPDAVIHLAWEGLPNYKSTFHTESNLPRQLVFLDNMISNGLKNLSVTGTCFEYGMQEGCLNEEMPACPANAYAIAKNLLRIGLQELQQKMGFQLKWIRLFYMYGKGQFPNSLFSQLDKALSDNDEVFNMSGGEQVRDYLPVEKMSLYIVKIALQNSVTGIINCCSGQPVTIKQLVTEYLKDKNRTIRLNTGFYPYSDYEPMQFWGDNSKLEMINKMDQPPGK